MPRLCLTELAEVRSFHRAHVNAFFTAQQSFTVKDRRCLLLRADAPE